MSCDCLVQTNNWQWKFKENSINIYYEEHEKESTEPTKNILMIPTISDVSTVEEWRLVAKDIVQQVGKVNWRATIIDWPGLGYSDRPKLDFNADVMEKFLVDFINSPSSPISSLGEYIEHQNLHIFSSIILQWLIFTMSHVVMFNCVFIIFALIYPLQIHRIISVLQFVLLFFFLILLHIIIPWICSYIIGHVSAFSAYQICLQMQVLINFY